MTRARDNATQGGLILVSSTRFAGVSEIATLNLERDNSYRVIIKFQTSGSYPNIYMNLKNGSSNISSTYTGACFHAMYNGSTGIESNWNGSSGPIFIGYTNLNMSFDYYLPSTNMTTPQTIFSGQIYDESYGRAKFISVTDNTGLSNGFNIYPGSGTITGLMQVYKYKD